MSRMLAVMVVAWSAICLGLLWFCAKHFTKHDAFKDQTNKEAVRHLRIAFSAGFIFFALLVGGLLLIFLHFKK